MKTIIGLIFCVSDWSKTVITFLCGFAVASAVAHKGGLIASILPVDVALVGFPVSSLVAKAILFFIVSKVLAEIIEHIMISREQTKDAREARIAERVKEDLQHQN